MREVGIELEFSGDGVDEIGKVIYVDHSRAPAVNLGDTIIRVDARYFRPSEVETLLGDPTKAGTTWLRRRSLRKRCAEMVSYDVKEAERTKLLREHGLDRPHAIEK